MTDWKALAAAGKKQAVEVAEPKPAANPPRKHEPSRTKMIEQEPESSDHAPSSDELRTIVSILTHKSFRGTKTECKAIIRKLTGSK